MVVVQCQQMLWGVEMNFIKNTTQANTLLPSLSSLCTDSHPIMLPSFLSLWIYDLILSPSSNNISLSQSFNPKYWSLKETTFCSMCLECVQTTRPYTPVSISRRTLITSITIYTNGCGQRNH